MGKIRNGDFKKNGIYYKKYLESDEWAKRRELVASRKNFTCEKCGKRVDNGYHIHHKTYKHLGNEPLCDLQFLCEDCHKLLHLEKEKEKLRNRMKTERLFCVYWHDGVCYKTGYDCKKHCKDKIVRTEEDVFEEFFRKPVDSTRNPC